MIDKIQRKYKGDKEKGATSVLVLLDSMLDVLGEKLTGLDIVWCLYGQAVLQ